MIKVGKVPDFVQGIRDVLPEALQEFPRACFMELHLAFPEVTQERAAESLPLINEIFLRALDEYIVMYGARENALFGEWEKFSVLAIKNMRRVIAEKGIAGTVEGAILQSAGVVDSRCYELYQIKKECGKTNFI